MTDTAAFVFVLPQKRLRSYNNIASFMLLFAVVEFAIVMYHYPSPLAIISYSIPLAFIIGYWVYAQQKLADRNTKLFLSPALFAAAAGWLIPFGSNLFIGLLYLIAGALEHKARTPQRVIISNKDVTVTGFPEKHIDWRLLTNVVLKDNLLTIDYKSNKLFQSEVAIVTTDLQEASFNRFCAENLKKSQM